MPATLVTAGATRNPIDAIRYLSAGSTGRTGCTLALSQSAHGPVHLLASPEAALRAAAGPTIEEYGSTRDLMSRMERWVRANPGGTVVHAAAVGDYEADATGAKLPSGKDELVLRLTPTPKILDRVRGWDPTCRLVSFKAASPETTDAELEEIARRQLLRTGSDLVFANIIGKLGQRVLLVSADQTHRFDDRGSAVQALSAWLSAGG